MGGVVEAAVCGLVSQVIGYFVLLPLGLILAGYLLFILTETLRELCRQRRK